MSTSRQPAKIGLLLTVGLCLSLPAHSGVVLDQVYTMPRPMPLGANINEGFELVAQTFTAGVSGHLVGVTADIFDIKLAATDPLTVTIRAAAGQTPSPTILATKVLTADSLMLSEIVEFNPPVSITAGTEYAIVVQYADVPHGAGQGRGNWMGSNSNEYPAGRGTFSNDGVSWAPTSFDLFFRTYVDTGDVSYKFAVMGDSRGSNLCSATRLDECVAGDALKKIFTEVANQNPNFTFFSGDMIYGTDSYDQVSLELDHWRSTIEQDDPPHYTGMGSGFVQDLLYPVFGGHERNTLTCSNVDTGAPCSGSCSGGATCQTSPFAAYGDFFDPVANAKVKEFRCDDNSACSATSPCAVGSCNEVLVDSNCDYFSDPQYGRTVYYCEIFNAGFFALNDDCIPLAHATPGSTVDDFDCVGHQLGSAQQAWVAGKLTAQDPMAIRHNFFFHHEPAYALGAHNARFNLPYGPNGELAESMDNNKPERNLYIDAVASRATAMFSGHEHQYSRREINRAFASDPVNLANDTPPTVPHTIWEIKTGSAGAGWYDAVTTSPLDYTKNTPAKVINLSSPWRLKIDEPVHFAMIEVQGDEVTLNVSAMGGSCGFCKNNGRCNITNVSCSGTNDPVCKVCSNDTGKSCTVAQECLAAPVILDTVQLTQVAAGGSGSITQFADVDSDGALNAVEGLEDSDGDGIPNFEDPDAVKVAGALGGLPIGLDVPDEPRASSIVPIALTDVEPLDDADPAVDQGTKPDRDFVSGLVGGEITGLVPGATVDLTLEFVSGVPQSYEYYAFSSPSPSAKQSGKLRTPAATNRRARPGKGGGGWETLGIQNAGGGTITVTVTDGGPGDGDGLVNGQISHIGGLAAPRLETLGAPEALLELLEPSFRYTADTVGCMPHEDFDLGYEDGFVGRMDFVARLTNMGARSFGELSVDVTLITNGNIVENADGAPGGTGSTISIAPGLAGYEDEVLGPDESTEVSFSVCLRDFDSFTLDAAVVARQVSE